MRIPTLVIWGESDRIATRAYAEVYADAFANAELTIIPQVGHLPQIE